MHKIFSKKKAWNKNKEKFNSTVLELFDEYFTTRKDSFQEQLDKLKITEETN